MALEMAMELITIVTVVFIKDNLIWIRDMGMAQLHILTKIDIKDIGSMTKKTMKGHTNLQMGLSLLDNSKMESNMEKEYSTTVMEDKWKEYGWIINSMDMGISKLEMLFMMVTLNKELSMGREEW